MAAGDIRKLNERMDVNPGNNYGTRFDQLIELLNANKASIAIITAQLDADGGVADTDYAANGDVTVADVVRI